MCLRELVDFWAKVGRESSLGSWLGEETPELGVQPYPGGRHHSTHWSVYLVA